MKRKQQQLAEQLDLLEYADRVQEVIQESNSDPDYKRLNAIFAQLSRDINHAESPTPTNF